MASELEAFADRLTKALRGEAKSLRRANTFSVRTHEENIMRAVTLEDVADAVERAAVEIPGDPDAD